MDKSLKSYVVIRTLLILISCTTGILYGANPLFYHCESSKLKNGKAKFDNQVIDFSYDQKPPFNRFAMSHYAQGQLVKSLEADAHKLFLNQLTFDRKKYLQELAALQLLARPMLASDFWQKKVISQLSIIVSPITGDASVSLYHYWKQQDGLQHQHGQFEFAFLPHQKFIQRSERLPFENLGLYAGEYFVQVEKETGFAVNLDTAINSAFLGHSLKCRNRLIKEKIQLPLVKRGELDSTKFLKEANDVMPFIAYAHPYLELIFEALVHKTPYTVSVPKLQKLLKNTQFSQQLKNALPLNMDKKVWVLGLIKKYLDRSRPQQLKQANLQETTELLMQFEGILNAILG